MDAGGSSAGGRRRNPDRQNSKRGRSEEVEQDSGSQATPRQRTKSVARKRKEPAKTPDAMTAREFLIFRQRNPYRSPQEGPMINRPFWNKEQQCIYMDILKAKKNLYVETKSIDIEHMRTDLAYFGEALALCEQFNLIKIMTFNKDFDAELVAQFYATLFFHNDPERTISWMTHGKKLQSNWKTFMDGLGYPDEGEDFPVGVRPHKNPDSAHKSKLLPYQHFRQTAKGEVKELVPFLDIMHRIFRNTLFPRIGNFDMVHSYLIDMLLLCKKEQGKDSVLDVSHIMWRELRSAVLDRKVPIYGPYLFKLIEDTWAANHPTVPLETGELVSHGVIKLRKKDSWGAAPEVQIADSVSDEEEPDFEFVPSSGRKPSWAEKLKKKVRKLFCLQSDVQHRLYEAHVAEKMSRRRQIKMMRNMGINEESGSEQRITPEVEWTSRHSKWTDSDDSAGATSAPGPDAAADAEEDSESEDEASE